MTKIRVDILAEIVKERDRQDLLKAQGKFPWTCADVGPGPAAKLAVLAEEFGEVAREVCEHNLPNLREELIQVAAVCLAWVEGLDQ